MTTAHQALAQRALSNIARIERHKLPNNKGWKYVAVMHDGTTEVVRAKATRSYSYANLYDGMACTGKSGLGEVITFSSNAKATKGWTGALPIKTYGIQESQA